jgi:hypothetical protein
MQREDAMSKFACTVLLAALSPALASAQIAPRNSELAAPGPQLLLVHHEDADKAPPAQLMTSIPQNTWTVAEWYKASIYDMANNKIGEIKDVLVDHDGKNVAAIVGVGGFLGVGEKDVAVAFDAVHFKQKDNKWYAVLNTTKDALKGAPGYKFDRTALTWVPASSTAGGPSR